MRKCPKCAEDIKVDAVLCKHCKSELTPLSKEEIKKLKSDNEKAQYVPGWFVLLTFIGCGLWIYHMANADSGEPITAPSTLSQSPPPISDSTTFSESTSQSLKHVSVEFVCKAATAENMGRKVATMSANKVGNKYHVTYRRPSDNSKWGIYCWLQDNRVLWQTDGTNGTTSDGRPGRVRNGQWDEVITFSAKPNRLTVNIKQSDGSGHSQVYKIPEDA